MKPNIMLVFIGKEIICMYKFMKMALFFSFQMIGATGGETASDLKRKFY